MVSFAKVLLTVYLGQSCTTFVSLTVFIILHLISKGNLVLLLLFITMNGTSVPLIWPYGGVPYMERCGAGPVWPEVRRQRRALVRLSLILICLFWIEWFLRSTLVGKVSFHSWERTNISCLNLKDWSKGLRHLRKLSFFLSCLVSRAFSKTTPTWVSAHEGGRGRMKCFLKFLSWETIFERKNA